MKDVLGIINVKVQDDMLRELTDFRCIASVPFGGRYRLIDFILSGMANSGMQKVAVFTLFKCRSLMDHLGTGKSWDLNRKENGLRILPPNAFYSSQDGYPGDIRSFYSQMDFFERSRQKDVIISPGNLVCNVGFREAIAFHRENGADITVFYREEEGYEYEPDGPVKRRVKVNKDSRVLQLEEEPGTLEGNKVLAGIFIMSKLFLVEMIENAIMNGADDLFRDVILKYQDTLKIYAYPVRGYFAAITSIKGYYQANMDLLNPAIRKSLFFQPGPVYTKVKDEPPTKYAAGSRVTNSLLANGCLVEGTVENSILFRGVRVKKGAFVGDSIIMQKGEIEEDAAVEYAILDKDVTISRGKEILGRENSPVVIGKRKKL
ncbi:glucose-1-phosphate adenylyltransferase subunit GlgD [Candidatus Micrarchaeota archaeon]|nr:glucose-1-phosphate adenylyltransferase subunit GlgD [Candidatus Micrarchaeota archaeon]